MALSAFIEDEAAETVNPRPSPQVFKSLSDRLQAHDGLIRQGRAEDARGNWAEAQRHFANAYPLLFKPSTLLSELGVRLKRGEAELVAACLRRLVSSATLGPAERRLAETLLNEAQELVTAVRSIADAPATFRLNAVEERAARHSKLVQQARQHSEAGDPSSASALFREAWPLLFRPSTLISATVVCLIRDQRLSCLA